MSPDHDTGRGGAACRLIDAPRCPIGSVVIPHGSVDRVGKNPSLKADLAIYSYIVTVSVQYLSVAITLSNKMNFSYCDNTVSFHKSSHIYMYIYIKSPIVAKLL